jgi:hypothetical protein
MTTDRFLRVSVEHGSPVDLMYKKRIASEWHKKQELINNANLSNHLIGHDDGNSKFVSKTMQRSHELGKMHLKTHRLRIMKREWLSKHAPVWRRVHLVRCNQCDRAQ